jgi:hypothetical protein
VAVSGVYFPATSLRGRPFITIYRMWRLDGTWEKINAVLYAQVCAFAQVATPTWPDPVFCTRCYESVSTDSSSSGLPLASSTFLARSAVFANCAGVW